MARRPDIYPGKNHYSKKSSHSVLAVLGSFVRRPSGVLLHPYRVLVGHGQQQNRTALSALDVHRSANGVLKVSTGHDIHGIHMVT